MPDDHVRPRLAHRFDGAHEYVLYAFIAWTAEGS